jgi:hypothetical protein
MICSSVNRFRFIVRIPFFGPDSNSFWRKILGAGQFLATTLREERGVYQLADARRGDMFNKHWDFETEIKNYFLSEQDTEKAIDVVELFYRVSKSVLNNQYSFTDWLPAFQDSVERLNTRFKEHGVGYSLEENSIIRIDSELVHQQVIKPALKLLHDKQFKNAEDEYLKAHEHFRNGRYDDCNVSCLKALETTIKIIGHRRKWKMDDKDTASKLIEHVMSNKLIPDYLQTHFNALRSCLQTGVPTVRNKAGGHGKGINAVAIPSYMAEYLLAESAAAIRLLVQADKQTPK